MSIPAICGMLELMVAESVPAEFEAQESDSQEQPVALSWQ
jgi:hypothetical protein